MKCIFLSLLGAGLLLGAGALALSLDSSPILIESRESKTIQGGPVFNRIKKISASGKTIWMMQQSHDGINAPPEKWERLAIVLDHQTKTAEYFQLEHGPLEWDPNAKQEPLRVACGLCHSNGPRAIRPNFQSAEAKISLKDQIRLFTWNLSTKLNGRMAESPLEKIKDATSRLGQNPFRYRGELENQPLQVKTCTHCHKERGFLARGPLTRQNFMAIRFMVESGSMPPPGFTLTSAEKAELAAFVDD